MQDLVNFVMLVLASVAAMILGVLSAYGVCIGAFNLMLWHSHRNQPVSSKATVRPASAS